MKSADKEHKTYYITTLGCKVNQSESDAIGQSLKASGWVPAASKTEAKVHIVNTCAVTGKAAMQSRQAVRRAIRSEPTARVIVTGCYAQVEPDEINKIDGVCLIIGQAFKHRIADQVEHICKNKRFSLQTIITSDIGIKHDFGAFSTPYPENRTRPFLKIQDGCNSFCTYCIVPYARGRSRSMPPDIVLTHLTRFKQAGYREVVLSGVHLGCYGIDLSPQTTLYDLLARIHDPITLDRVRLSSIEPHELSEDIIRLVGTSDRFCRHFHIPLQSGDDLILKKMNRPYSQKDFKGLIHRIRRFIPDACIGVDTLIGFPGETEAAFENTYNLIEALPVSYLHVFPYSARRQTMASRYSDRIPPPIIKDRCRKMRILGELKKETFYKGYLGKTVEILIESKRDPASGLLKGFTSNLIPVFISGRDELINTIVSAKIVKLSGTKPLFGEMVSYSQ